MANKKIDKYKIGRVEIGNNINNAVTTPSNFKTNLEKHFVNCARNYRLWEAFTEFKLKTENDQIFANSVKSLKVRDSMNKVILDAFSKIDTSTTNYKYYKSMSKLKNRYKDGLNLFSNSYLESKKDYFMDDIMQEIIDRDISFLEKSDREIFQKLFSISSNSNFENQSGKLDELSKLYDSVFPEDDQSTGKFSSVKIAQIFKNLNELCKRVNNYETSIISSNAINDPTLSFDEALAKFRLDLKKSCIPVLEVENMYHNALNIKPLDISHFIYDQEKRFVDAFLRKHPGMEINYARPKLYISYPFVKFTSLSSYDYVKTVPEIKHVKKSFISENLKKMVYKLGGVTNFIKKISLKLLPFKKYTRQNRRIIKKTSNKTIVKSRTIDDI